MKWRNEYQIKHNYVVIVVFGAFQPLISCLQDYMQHSQMNGSFSDNAENIWWLFSVLIQPGNYVILQGNNITETIKWVYF